MRVAIRRAASGLVALGMTSALSACFVHTDTDMIAGDLRADIPWLEGSFRNPDGVAFAVTREAPGLYRFAGVEPVRPDAEEAEELQEMRSAVAVLAGDCSQPPVEDLPADACEWSAERLCADEETRFSEDAAECLRLVAALRDPSKLAAMPPREAAMVASLRWIAEGEPHRDDVLFATTPLDIAGSEADWALAQVLGVESFGVYTDLGILAPQLLPFDLVLVERVEAGGFRAWATTACAPETADAEDAIPAAEALELLTACAAGVAASDDAASQRSDLFRPE